MGEKVVREGRAYTNPPYVEIEYAAKRFYYIGSNSGRGAISIKDDVKNLRHKMMRQQVAEKSLVRFNEQVKSNKINAYGQFISDKSHKLMLMITI